jgi:hypothetical protein
MSKNRYSVVKTTPPLAPGYIVIDRKNKRDTVAFRRKRDPAREEAARLNGVTLKPRHSIVEQVKTLGADSLPHDAVLSGGLVGDLKTDAD